jgi:hypothetical protein
VARNERDAARLQLEAATKPRSEVTRVARKPRAETVAEKPPEEPKKQSRWERLKAWLAEDPSKPKKKD